MAPRNPRKIIPVPFDEDNYKRSDDRIWRERTDERLASLTGGENIQNDRLDEIEEGIAEIDRILRGDPEKDTGGIVEHLHELQTGFNHLRALMAPDALGGGGVLNRLKALEKEEARKERREEYHWKFWLALVAFASATTVAVITNLGRIETFWRHATRPTDAVDRMIDDAKHPHVKRIRVRVRSTPEDDEGSE